MKKKTKPKDLEFFLYAKPARPPKWWPRKGRFYSWVGVLREGSGWRTGDGDGMTRAEIRLAQQLVEIKKPLFRLQVRTYRQHTIVV